MPAPRDVARRRKLHAFASAVLAVVAAAAAQRPDEPDGEDAAPRVENYWRAERLRATGLRALTFVEWFTETDFPVLLLAMTIFLVFVGLAYVVPSFFYRGLQLWGAAERPARAVWVVSFLATLVFGAALSFAGFGLSLWHSVAALSVFSLWFSYGLATEVSNLTAGILLPLHEPIEIGAVIEVAGVRGPVRGTVVGIGLRFVKLLHEAAMPDSGEDAFTYIPNHEFSSSAHTLIVRRPPTTQPTAGQFVWGPAAPRPRKDE